MKTDRAVRLFAQDIQLIVRLDPAADTARFSHRPAAVADYSRPAFPL